MSQIELKLDILEDIIEELSSRATEDISVVKPYMGHSWEELCDEGLRIFNELRTRRVIC
jgi:hypothetical protein